MVKRERKVKSFAIAKEATKLERSELGTLPKLRTFRREKQGRTVR